MIYICNGLKVSFIEIKSIITVISEKNTYAEH